MAWAASDASASAAQSSIGRETKTGPARGEPGEVDSVGEGEGDVLGARRLEGPLDERVRHPGASRLVGFACIVTWARTCWPAVTSNGDLFAWALKIAPSPFPTPGAVCRLTWAGRPDACA